MYLIITTHKTTNLDLACEQNQEWLLLNCNILTAKNSEQIKTNWAASVKERQDVCATLHGRISDILSIIKLTVCALFIFFISQVPSPENEKQHGPQEFANWNERFRFWQKIHNKDKPELLKIEIEPSDEPQANIKP